MLPCKHSTEGELNADDPESKSQFRLKDSLNTIANETKSYSTVNFLSIQEAGMIVC